MFPFQPGNHVHPFTFLPVPPSNESVQPSPPPGVRAAMYYLKQLDEKTQKRIALNDTQLEVVDGEPLTNPEVSARDAACRLLTKYFDGCTDLIDQEVEKKLAPEPQAPPNPLEALDRLVSLMEGQMTQRTPAAQARQNQKQQTHQNQPCAACDGTGDNDNDEDCSVCKGRGWFPPDGR